jgi:hypothetical protein
VYPHAPPGSVSSANWRSVCSRSSRYAAVTSRSRPFAGASMNHCAMLRAKSGSTRRSGASGCVAVLGLTARRPVPAACIARPDPIGIMVELLPGRSAAPDPFPFASSPSLLSLVCSACPRSTTGWAGLHLSNPATSTNSTYPSSSGRNPEGSRSYGLRITSSQAVLRQWAPRRLGRPLSPGASGPTRCHALVP